MARVNAIKPGEQLRVGAIEDEVASQRRGPGLQIVILAQDGSKQVAHSPPQMLDVLDVTTPAPEAEPAIPSDADAERP
jgi:hypothetical protein